MLDAGEKPLVRIVMAGHVDHGKSTLIGRIRHEICALADAAALDGSVAGNWAFSMDQLQEERDNMMTIDTAQTFIDTPESRLVFIDVPGHQELIENMITGATRADAAVLVLAADEGVKVQTRRHTLLLGMLGIRGVVVAINKMDLVGFGEAAFRVLEEAVTATLAEMGVESYAVIPIVALDGDNVLTHSARMPWYDGPALLEVLLDLEPPAEESQVTRLPVQDVYSIDGETVVVGRLLTGRLGEGDVLRLLPDEAECKVTEIKRFPADHLPAVAGESIGVVLSGIKPVRGQVLVPPGDRPRVSTSLDGQVFWLGEAPLEVGDSLVLRCATQAHGVTVAGITERIDSATLDPQPAGGALASMQIARVLVTSEKPMVFEPFARIPGLGRFVLERGGRGVGFGIVT
ncbi:MAG TPA: GTP-binding protein [Thermoanaerobaculaceae bacterium]|nr:GTP-binding protein [Thermoanaerobaculaceae bacterium]HPS76789.1 GTP-binding protein [Thermoanaerobaculaceae bacterium]